MQAFVTRRGDADGSIIHVNAAGEQLLRGSATYLKDKAISNLLPEDSPVFSLIDKVQSMGRAVSEYDVTLESPRIGKHYVNIRATPVPEWPGIVILAFHQRFTADKVDHRHAQVLGHLLQGNAPRGAQVADFLAERGHRLERRRNNT